MKRKKAVSKYFEKNKEKIRERSRNHMRKLR